MSCFPVHPNGTITFREFKWRSAVICFIKVPLNALHLTSNLSSDNSATLLRVFRTLQRVLHCNSNFKWRQTWIGNESYSVNKRCKLHPQLSEYYERKQPQLAICSECMSYFWLPLHARPRRCRAQEEKVFKWEGNKRFPSQTLTVIASSISISTSIKNNCISFHVHKWVFELQRFLINSWRPCMTL